MATVDVVIPCCNHRRYLRGCVASVLGQQGVAVRILIVDNASGDDSADVARSLAAEDPRVEVVARATNLGATASYNEGIDWAACDYFQILDADDMLAPGALARATRWLDRNPGIAFAYGVEARLVDSGAMVPPRVEPGETEADVTTGLDFIRQLCRTPVDCVGADTVVRRTSVQKRVGYYNDSLPHADELEMWLRLAASGDVAFIDAIQAIRRDHVSRRSSRDRSVQVRDLVEREKAFESFFATDGRNLPAAGSLMAEARRGLGRHAYWSAVSHVARGQRQVGAELLRLSHRLRPAAALMPPLGWLVRAERPVERVRAT